MVARKVILVADDHAALKHVVQQFLHDEGYEVLVAADGDEVIVLSGRTKDTLVSY